MGPLRSPHLLGGEFHHSWDSSPGPCSKRRPGQRRRGSPRLLRSAPLPAPPPRPRPGSKQAALRPRPPPLPPPPSAAQPGRCSQPLAGRRSHAAAARRRPPGSTLVSEPAGGERPLRPGRLGGKFEAGGRGQVPPRVRWAPGGGVWPRRSARRSASLALGSPGRRRGAEGSEGTSGVGRGSIAPAALTGGMPPP